MRREAVRQGTDSEEFKSQFTADGKIDFQARVGLDRSRDPFKRIDYPIDTVETVVFDEHRQFQSHDLDHHGRNFGSDDDDGYSERW